MRRRQKILLWLFLFIAGLCHRNGGRACSLNHARAVHSMSDVRWRCVWSVCPRYVMKITHITKTKHMRKRQFSFIHWLKQCAMYGSHATQEAKRTHERKWIQSNCTIPSVVHQNRRRLMCGKQCVSFVLPLGHWLKCSAVPVCVCVCVLGSWHMLPPPLPRCLRTIIAIMAEPLP